MVLRNQVEWALHSMLLLAGVPEGGALPAQALAEFHEVPREYLAKALQALSHAGLLATALGPAGGYRLARPAAAITLLEIVEAVEGPRKTFRCDEIRHRGPCGKAAQAGPKSLCTIAQIMFEADEAWRRSLRGHTLAVLAATVKTKTQGAYASDFAAWVEPRLRCAAV